MSDSSAITAPALLPGLRALSPRISARAIKITLAVTLVSAGAYGLLQERQFISSSNAVVSAYVLDVRTPIDGTLSALPATAGSVVHRGDILGHLDNPRVDRQHLDNLQSLENSAQFTADSLAAERADLDAQRLNLLARAAKHTTSVAERTESQVASAASALATRQLASTQANIELDRGRKLHDAGIIANAEFDRLVSAQQIAAEQVTTQRADLAALRSELASARHGLLSEPGTNNDVAYSRQRADELSLKLAENRRLLSASRMEAGEAHHAVAAESARADLMRQTDLVSPINGILWKLGSINGERAASGDSVLSLVDCSRQFLIVGVPQDRVSDIALRGQARFRLAGESTERTGTVLSVSGDAQSSTTHKLAAIPERQPSQQLASIIVALDPATSAAASSDSCTVGRTARVLIPTASSSLASRWFRLGL